MKTSRRRMPENSQFSAARLIAVQALYQLELAGGTPDEAVVHAQEFSQNFGDEIDNYEFIGPDPLLIRRLVCGVVEQGADLDKLIDTVLKEDRSANRLETVLRITLRAGVYELLNRSEIDPPIVINEYVDIAKAFFNNKEPALVNGVLDRLAHTLRPSENKDSRL